MNLKIMRTKPQIAPTPKPGSTACIARQPILTEDQKVVGYELFFRERGEEQRFSSDGETATSSIIDTLNLIGLRVLCDGHTAFVNCTHQGLLTDYFALLRPDDVVIEIQEGVPANAETVKACQRLKERKFSLALDNFMPDDPREALVFLADFIKVDITRVGSQQYAAMVEKYAGKSRLIVATKVESRLNFLSARSAGFNRFQGYFFHHPENMQARQIPANQATYLRLLNEVSKPQVNFAEIEALIKREPALCFRLLRYLNSPLLGLSSPVESVRSALNLLGETEAVKWIRMATTLAVGQEKSSDLVLSSLVRARFCELIAPRVEHGKADLFLMGMLSLLDAILSVPIGMLIGELSLDPAIKAQLLAAKSGDKTPLTPIYDLMVAREMGDWSAVTRLGKQLNLSLSFIAERSNAAMQWAYEVTRATRSAERA
jgi:c-di-GMP-related signal transduction protein